MFHACFRLSAVIIALTMLGSSCEQQQQPAGPRNTGLPTTTMQIGNETFTLEIAADDKSKEIGLMNRASMPADHGMIFVFARDQQQSFWMKNTRIALDIIYVDSTGTVVSVHSMKPLDLTGVESAAPAKYAIELNQGAAARAGVRPGMIIQISPEVASADGR